MLAGTTERLAATNAELHEALALRDRFLSIAAHELRTPMTSLSLQLALLQRRIEHGADRDTLVPTPRRSGVRRTVCPSWWGSSST